MTVTVSAERRRALWQLAQRHVEATREANRKRELFDRAVHAIEAGRQNDDIIRLILGEISGLRSLANSNAYYNRVLAKEILERMRRDDPP